MVLTYDKNGIYEYDRSELRIHSINSRPRTPRPLIVGSVRSRVIRVGNS